MYVMKDFFLEIIYWIRIQVINEIGVGLFSQFIKVKIWLLLFLFFRLECVVVGFQSLKLKWGDSNFKIYVVDDMVYILQLEDRNKRFILIYRGFSYIYKVQRLMEFICYFFRI